MDEHTLAHIAELLVHKNDDSNRVYDNDVLLLSNLRTRDVIIREGLLVGANVPFIWLLFSSLRRDDTLELFKSFPLEYKCKIFHLDRDCRMSHHIYMNELSLTLMTSDKDLIMRIIDNALRTGDTYTFAKLLMSTRAIRIININELNMLMNYHRPLTRAINREYALFYLRAKSYSPLDQVVSFLCAMLPSSGAIPPLREVARNPVIMEQIARIVADVW